MMTSFHLIPLGVGHLLSSRAVLLRTQQDYLIRNDFHLLQNVVDIYCLYLTLQEHLLVGRPTSPHPFHYLDRTTLSPHGEFQTDNNSHHRSVLSESFFRLSC